MADAADDPFTVDELRSTMRKLDPTKPVYIYNRYAGVPERFVVAETEQFGVQMCVLWPTGTAMDGASLNDDQELLCPKCRGEMRWEVRYDHEGPQGVITGARWVHREETDCDG